MEVNDDLLNIIFNKIKDYSPRTNYTPLKVTFNIDSPIYITTPFLNFDSILSYLCMREALGELFYILPTDVNVNTNNLKLPLKRTNDVYHSSVSMFNNPKLFKDTIYKRFTDAEIHNLNPKRYKKVRVGSGYYKGFMINLPALLSDTVTFYCNADKEELEYLLPNLTHLGKKPSIGGGHIKNFTINETSEDYSFIKDGEVMRPIPTKSMNIELTQGMSFQRQPYKPPYWNKDNISICYMPKSQISTI